MIEKRIDDIYCPFWNRKRHRFDRPGNNRDLCQQEKINDLEEEIERYLEIIEALNEDKGMNYSASIVFIYRFLSFRRRIQR